MNTLERRVMNVRIQPLRKWFDPVRALRDDGWDIETGPGGTLSARHPKVPDEGAARDRLCRLGLLMSGSLRIDFEQPRAGP